MPRFTLGDALVLSPPGLGPLTVREARRLNLDAAAISNDRRADVVGIRRPPDVFSLRTAEDVLALAGTLPVRRTAAATAAALDNVALVDALAVVRRAERARRRRLRVVVRLSDERHFRRTDLRAALERKLDHLHGPEVNRPGFDRGSV